MTTRHEFPIYQPTRLTMSVGRDTRMTTRYEFVIYQGDSVVAQAGCFTSYAKAKRAGRDKAAALIAADPQLSLNL